MTHFKNILLAAFAAAVFFPVQGALLIDESFNDLTGWTDATDTGSGGNWTVGTNLTYSGLASSDGAASELTSSTGQQLSNNIALGSPAGGAELWGSFLMNWSESAAADRDSGLGSLVASANRIVMRTSDRGATDGVNVEWRFRDNVGGNTYTSGGAAVGLDLDTTYLFVFKIEIAANAADSSAYVWLDPTLGSTAPTNASANWSFDGATETNIFNTSSLDQWIFNSDNLGQVTYDELRISNAIGNLGWAEVTPIPEPSTFALLGLAGLAVMVGLKRRR